MILDDPRLPEFLEAQMHACGANVELESGLWLVFAVEAGDASLNELTRTLLAGAGFAYDLGQSDDDQWMLYYVDTPNRPAALHWLEDLHRQLGGGIRPVAPTQRALIRDIVASPMPHRLAQRLAEQHTRNELPAGAVADPTIVRALLDRLHQREPLFYNAFQLLLTHHLFDLVVLLQKMIPEDIELQNELVKGGISRDPFLQTRQDAAAEIRRILTQFHLINPLDQQRTTAIRNPYAAFMEIARNGDKILATIDGNIVPVPQHSFVNAIHSTRRNIYRGATFGALDTQAPWVTDEIAYPFRFMKQRLEAKKQLSTLDGLFMLERAMEP